MLQLDHTDFILPCFSGLLMLISWVGCLLLSLFYLCFYARALRVAKQSRNADTNWTRLPISILVYAKNDAENLRKHLPALLTQDYPEYQVVVINDGSTDETDDVLKMFQQKYRHLYHTYVPANARYLSRRKLAFTLGAKAAKHEILVFTEANCQPVCDQWLTALSQAYSEQTHIVLGYCKYKFHRGFWQRFIAYDQLLNGLRALTPALFHRPFTADGRNLSYRKRLFFEHRGYAGSLNLHAGDDDLFVNETATPTNTAVVLRAESLTEMDPVNRLNSWLNAKKMRVGTQRHYKGWQRSIYHLESIGFFLFQGAVFATWATAGITYWPYSLSALLAYLVRFGVKAAVFYQSAQLFQQPLHVGGLFLFELIQPLLDGYLQVNRLFQKQRDYTFHLEK